MQLKINKIGNEIFRFLKKVSICISYFLIRRELRSHSILLSSFFTSILSASGIICLKNDEARY
jgi:hypothetical protein